ncbi:hypothetical protein EMCRGX_G024367 [Ephydatia muelleri]
MAVSQTMSQMEMETQKRWNCLSSMIGMEAKKRDFFTGNVTASCAGKGRLVILGSGIRCAGQFTTEAISHIKNADKVLYCISDPVTETYIRDLFPGAMDLAVFFDGSKDRYDSCVQMAEACLFFARQGLYTVAIFPGHPGISSLPSLRAMQIAKKQGICTEMLPGISLEDSLFSDLGIDPSYYGFQVIGATDFLLFDRRLMTDAHVVIKHVGCIGEQCVTPTGVGASNLSILVKQLQKVYGLDYGVVHYYPSQYPTCKPFMDRRPLSDFLKSEMYKTITPFSHIYIPPMSTSCINKEMAVQLGIACDLNMALRLGVPTSCLDVYGPREKQAITDMTSWRVPSGYWRTPMSSASRYLAHIGMDVGVLQRHMLSPLSVMTMHGLSPFETTQIVTGDPLKLFLTAKPDPTYAAHALVTRLCVDPVFASSCVATGRRFQYEADGEEMLGRWLCQQGYETTVDAVQRVFGEIQMAHPSMWIGSYTTNISDVGSIQIQGSKIMINNEIVLQAISYTTRNAPIEGKIWGCNEQEPTACNVTGEKQFTTGGPSSMLERTINFGFATKLLWTALTKGWACLRSVGDNYKGLSASVFADIEKANVALTIAEDVLLKTKIDFQTITQLASSQFDAMEGTWLSADMRCPFTGSVFIPHVPTVCI